MSKRVNKDVYNRGDPRGNSGGYHSSHGDRSVSQGDRPVSHGEGRGNKKSGGNEPEVSWHSPELSLVLPKKYHARAKEKFVEVDGSLLEGGGQILRISVALSCILAQPISISKIRACRPKPGLSAQHLAGLKLVALACEGDLAGATLRSTDVTLTPQCIRSGEFNVDTKTAGSVCLLLQTVMPCLLYAPLPSILALKGGTDADFAPPIDYFRITFSHYAKMFGITFPISSVLRGFNPRGCGEVRLSINPVKVINPVDITVRGNVTSVTVDVYLCGTLPSSIGERCLHAAQRMMERRFQDSKVPVKTNLSRDDESFGNGWGLCISARTSSNCLITACGNGNPKIKPEQLASETAEQLIRDIDEGGCVDTHMQDQLIILMGLANGVSKVRTGPLTLHTKTAIHVVEMLTDAQFSVIKDANCNLGEQSFLVECKGIGLKNVYLTD